ncbi:MAG: hypothetical protein IPK55_14755 [Streptococcus sp.]|nr:hypothetical protein [Streptococcus sp.]
MIVSQGTTQEDEDSKFEDRLKKQLDLDLNHITSNISQLLNQRQKKNTTMLSLKSRAMTNLQLQRRKREWSSSLSY